MMLGELNPCGGGDAIPLTQPKLLVGRRSRCDITLRFKNVSSHHCELELKNGYWHIRDLGSTNGVKVNGMRVEAKCLMPGDEVMISKHAFNIEYLVDANAAPPEEESPFQMSLLEKAGLEVGRDKESREERRLRSASARSQMENTDRNSADDFLMDWLSDE